MKKLLNIAYDVETNCCLDMYLPDGEGFSTVVYFHGGGIVSGDKAEANYTEIAEKFAANGYAFLSVNYRMYPDAKFPDYLYDAARAVAWAKQNIKGYGGSGDIYISGQSAGAWISSMLCLNDVYLKSVNVLPAEIKGWIIESSQMTSHFNVLKHEVGCNPNLQRIDEYAPLYYIDENTKFTRMLLLFYENDMACRVEQNMLFIKAIKYFYKDADIEYKILSGTHCHGSLVKDPDGEYPYVKESMRWLK